MTPFQSSCSPRDREMAISPAGAASAVRSTVVTAWSAVVSVYEVAVGEPSFGYETEVPLGVRGLTLSTVAVVRGVCLPEGTVTLTVFLTVDDTFFQRSILRVPSR